MVEAGRIELPSENLSADVSTGLVCSFKFPYPVFHKQTTGFGSFIIHDLLKALQIHVHCVIDALTLYHSYIGKAAALIRQRKLNFC